MLPRTRTNNGRLMTTTPPVTTLRFLLEALKEKEEQEEWRMGRGEQRGLTVEKMVREVRGALWERGVVQAATTKANARRRISKFFWRGPLRNNKRCTQRGARQRR